MEPAVTCFMAIFNDVDLLGIQELCEDKGSKSQWDKHCLVFCRKLI